jgi:hypothetical protein
MPANVSLKQKQDSEKLVNDSAFYEDDAEQYFSAT